MSLREQLAQYAGLLDSDMWLALSARARDMWLAEADKILEIINENQKPLTLLTNDEICEACSNGKCLLIRAMCSDFPSCKQIAEAQLKKDEGE